MAHRIAASAWAAAWPGSLRGSALWKANGLGEQHLLVVA